MGEISPRSCLKKNGRDRGSRHTELLRFLKTHPLTFSPKTIRQMFFIPWDSTNTLMDMITRDRLIEKAVTPSAARLQKSADSCEFCRKNGTGAKLQKCDVEQLLIALLLVNLKTGRDTRKIATCTPVSDTTPNKMILRDCTNFATSNFRTLLQIIPSAFDLFSDFSRAEQLGLYIIAEYHPLNSGFDKFTIVSATVVPKAKLIETEFLTLERIALVKEDKQKGKDRITPGQVDLGWDRVPCFVVFEVLRTQGHVNFEADISPSDVKELKFDPNWLQALKTKVPAGG